MNQYSAVEIAQLKPPADLDQCSACGLCCDGHCTAALVESVGREPAMDKDPKPSWRRSIWQPAKVTLYSMILLNHFAYATPDSDSNKRVNSNEDSIPVIEIRAEGKPMTSAQIRALEEEAEGRPFDIKTKQLKMPPQACSKTAKRFDFVTFHYKGQLENGKTFQSTSVFTNFAIYCFHLRCLNLNFPFSYAEGQPVQIQLKTGMIIPGLDKGLTGMCEQEVKRIQVPWRLAQRRTSSKWKRLPKDEHWIIFEIEMLHIEPWTIEKQFQYLDADKNGLLSEEEIVKQIRVLREEYGKSWRGYNVDDREMAKYFIDYFADNSAKTVSKQQYESRMSADLKLASSKKAKASGNRREPGLGWIFDFDNDGSVTYDELSKASMIFKSGYAAFRDANSNVHTSDHEL
ncbi:Uncharacterized protein T4B_8932 [Trichinella pseudospiralis]|uniref:peptidylprolyl isomerase n=2 Tax=Trichinella pseudospiralis TaxID=6337 RepID=A0A0V1IJ11_TRIPS|nr:Uncharacterized protein T4B_8932 [Trichinella pseudospiralis]